MDRKKKKKVELVWGPGYKFSTKSKIKFYLYFYRKTLWCKSVFKNKIEKTCSQKYFL